MRLSRTPAARLLVTAGLALVTFAYARAQLAGTGPLVEVPVVARPVRAGEVLRPRDVRTERRPAAHLPGEPLARGHAGRAAATDLVAGEVLVERRLGRPGLAALLPAGTRALAVPATDGTPALERGQRADLLAGGRLLVAGATVVHAGERAVTVAVPAADAPAVAHAVTTGIVVLALAG